MNNLVPHIICGISFILIIYLFCKNNKSKESFAQKNCEDIEDEDEKKRCKLFEGGTVDTINEPSFNLMFLLSFLRLPMLIGACLLSGLTFLFIEKPLLLKLILILLTLPVHLIFGTIIFLWMLIWYKWDFAKHFQISYWDIITEYEKKSDWD